MSGSKRSTYRDFLKQKIPQPSSTANIQSSPSAPCSSLTLISSLSAPSHGSSEQSRSSASSKRKSGNSRDYELDVMAATILNTTDSDLTLKPTLLNSSALDECYENIIHHAIRSTLSPPQDSVSSSLEAHLTSDKDGFIHPFGPSRARNKTTFHAIRSAGLLKQDLEKCLSMLRRLSPNASEVVIQATISEVERTVKPVCDEVNGITRLEAAQAVREAKNLIILIEESLKSWRQGHPDKSPFKIDNRAAFLNPSSSRNTSTLIAYTLALVNRVFDGASLRSTSFLLKAVGLFGLSLTMLNGGPNLVQQRALSDIPGDMRQVERRFNLDVKTVPYAVCPQCAYTHEPSYPSGSKKPIYPTTCTYRSTSLVEVCGAPLLEDDQPIKIFEYYPFYDWFGRFLALPGIEEYGERFCEAVSREPIAPADKRETWDGSFYRELKGPDGRLFIAERGEEGRWLFILHGDFFNVEGNRIGGQHTSTGVMSMTCLNLPLEIREDPAYTYIPGIIQGPHEPDATEAQHRHYLRPLVTDLKVAYTRGVQCFSTYNQYARGGHDSSYEKTFRPAIAGVVMDFKAARPFAGLLDISSHTFCFVCDIWHRAHLGRTDCEAWGRADDAYLKKGAEMWRDASTPRDRKTAEELHGTRYSELWQLPYWQPSRQLILDPMHIFYLILQQNFFRSALRLENPSATQNPKNKETAPVSHVAHHYQFTPPPPLSSLGSNTGADVEMEDNILSTLDWPHLLEGEQRHRAARMFEQKELITGDQRALDGVSDVHRKLSCPRPSAEPAKKELRKQLVKHKWIVLAYVSNDLMAFPSHRYKDLTRRASLSLKDISKGEMADALVKWRSKDIEEERQFVWPHFTPKTTPRPNAPWAHPPPQTQVYDGTTPCRRLNAVERQSSLGQLREKMSYNTALAIGHIHRFLCQPIEDSLVGKDDLAKKLSGKSFDALMFVCLDVDRVPLGMLDKDALINQLISWRMTQPTAALRWTAIDSPGVLAQVQKAVREVIVPAWISKPPSNVGLPIAGTLKADHWRRLFAIYLPLALLSLWQVDSPMATNDAAEMASVLQTSMYLTCASTIMTKKTLTSSDRESFRECLRQHVLGLQRNFPGFVLPSHHEAFHVFDFMDLFSNVRNFWCFGGERLIGKLRRIPTNHKTGELEGTLLHSFYKGASFRQWLLRPDCPPLFDECRKILDKAYGYSHASSEAVENKDDSAVNSVDYDEELDPAEEVEIKGGSELAQLVGSVTRCYSRATAPRGYYTIPTAAGKGNSFICFRPNGDPRAEWVAARIHYIFEKDGTKKFAVRRSKTMLQRRPDPFRAFWHLGFEARSVSIAFSDALEIVEAHWILAHTARWEITSDVAVVLNLNDD